MNLKIYMLGTGTAVPIRRGLPCIAMKIDSDIYVFDVGEGCQQRMIQMGLGIVKIKSIFITHLHGDHYLGLFGLLQSMHLLDKRDHLYIVTPSILIKLLENMKSKGLIRHSYPHEYLSVSEGEVYSDGKISVYAFKVDHTMDSYGYVIDVRGKYRIVYTGDTSPCESVVREAEKADLLIHESTFTSKHREEALEQKHTTAADAALIALKAGVKQLVLTHISPRYTSSEEVLFDAYRYYKKVIVAEDNMVLYF